MFTKLDNFIIEKNITTVSNKIAVHHWYTNEPCYVSIKESKHGKVLVSHNIEGDKLYGCPDWWINTYEIIGKVDESIPGKIDESISKHKGEIISLDKINKIYHKSNYRFRDKILNEGLKCMKGDSYNIYSPEDFELPAIFAYKDDIHYYDSTYDDDIWEISKNAPNIWYVDNAVGENAMVTYTDIPKQYIKLIYKGSEDDSKPIEYVNKNILEQQFIKESVYDIIKNTVKKKQGIYTVKNNDFHLIFDLDDDILELTWITINTNKFSGKEVLLGLIEYCKQFNITKIKATGVRGKHHGKDSYGYYVMLKWGFIPIEGITFINDVLNTNYKSFEEAFADSNFLPKWKINGIEFDGIFDLNKNSISFKLLNN